MKKTSIHLFTMALAVVGAHGQTSPTIKLQITDGTTPPALASGAPIGSYLTSDIEQINYYNGKLNLTIPLLQVGGRGEARYTITALATQPTWSMRVDNFADTISNGCNPSDANCVRYHFTSTPDVERAEPQWQAGYGPGRLLVKKVADGLTLCGASGYYILANAMTHIVFVTPDGTEQAGQLRQPGSR